MNRQDCFKKIITKKLYPLVLVYPVIWCLDCIECLLLIRKSNSSICNAVKTNKPLHYGVVFFIVRIHPSAFLVIDPNGIYSKHYYAGTQRIVSRLGEEKADIFNTGENRTTSETSEAKKLDDTALRNIQVTDLKEYLKEAKIGKVSFKEYKGSTYQEEEEAILAEDLKENSEEGNLEQERAPVSAPVYFYHPDHLGSSTFLTDANGNAYQFFINLPFGETMAQQLPDTYYRTPFKFNGKELDEVTGLYYYGARYYDPKISIWLSVDPLAEKYPNWNPYNYCMQNPINFVDPDGREIVDPKGNKVTYSVNKDGSLKWSKNATLDIKRIGNAMARSTEGLGNLNLMQSAKHKVYLNIDSKSMPTDVWGLALKSFSWDNKTKTGEVTKVVVTIYEANLKQFMADVNVSNCTFPNDEQTQEYVKAAKNNDLEAIIAADAGHEAVHAADKNNIKQSIENFKLNKNYDVEKVPEASETKILKEINKTP